MPSFTIWRIELLHPLSIHFPIALLTFGSLLYVVALFTSRWRAGAVALACAKLLIVCGAATAWIAVWSGNRAEEEVNRYLCDPTVTHRHGELAEFATWAFTAASLLLLAIERARSPRRILLSARVLTVVLLAFGVFRLSQASHLGAELVYLQAAAVYRPSEMCTEFE